MKKKSKNGNKKVTYNCEMHCSQKHIMVMKCQMEYGDEWVQLRMPNHEPSI